MPNSKGYGGNGMIDLNQLREDYRDGYSAMGRPDRGYYVTTNRGMQSLQAFSSSAVSYYGAGATRDLNVREIQIKNDGLDYDMKGWTERRYLNNLNDALRLVDNDSSIDGGYFGELNSEVYEAVIDSVYDGDVDKDAFIATSTDFEASGLYKNVKDAFRLDVLRAKDGDTDRYAMAAAHAYQNALAPEAHSVNFEGSEISNQRILGQERTLYNQDQWLRKGMESYLDYLLEDYDSTTANTVKLDDVKDLVENFSTDDHLYHFEARREEWGNVVDYMRKDIVFMLDPKTKSDPGRGMKHHDDVYDALGVDPLETFMGPNENSSSTFNIESGEESYHDDDFDLDF